MKLEITDLRLLGTSKNQIVVNGKYIFVLTLKKDRLYYSLGKRPHRLSLTAKRIAYTTEGVKQEIFGYKTDQKSK